MSYSTSEYDRPDEADGIDEVFPVKKTILFVFLTVLSCAYLPAAIFSFGSTQIPIYITIPAFVLFVSGIAFMFISVKRIGYSIFFTLVMFFLYSYTGSPVIPAIVSAVILAFALGGFISSLCDRKTCALLLLIPAVAYLGAFALTGNWMYSLVAIIPFPSMIAQGILQRKNAERKTIVLVSSALLLLMLAGFVALVLYMNGHLSYAAISSGITSFRNGIIDYMKDMSFEVSGETVPAFEAEYVDLFVAQTFNMLPGFTAVITFVIIYCSHSIQLAVYKSTDFDLMVTKKNSKISMSVYAAGLFILSYILSLSTDTAGNPDMLSAVAGNLRLMLTPGLLLVGFDALAVIVKKLRGFGFFVILLLFVGIFMLADYILLILAGVGAVYIIVTAIDVWAQKHYTKKNF